MLAMNYGPQTDPLCGLEHAGTANISVYARGRDYHELIKGRLKQLGSFMAGQHKDIGLKVFVDTAPVMEKPLAEAAGLGWQGKHTNLVSRDFGSWLFLAAIFTNFRFEPEIKAQDHCGHCQACLDICPTRAFPAPYQLNARRCISYLTIEHKGHIAREFRKPMRNRIYGCDDCLAVCPWNKFAQAAQEAKLQAREDFGELAIADLLRLDEAAFRSFFAGNPIKRIGHERFMRNLLIAAGNSEDPSLFDQVVEKLETPSPLIRAMAVWALGELMEADRLKPLYDYWFARETDPTVLQEWSHIFF
jgi:epoxyqueuosine reductase